MIAPALSLSRHHDFYGVALVDCDSLGPVWGGCCRAFHHPHSHTKISRRTFWKDLNKSTTAAIRPLAPSHHSPTPTPTLLVQSTAPHALVAAAHKPSGGRKRKSSAFPFHVLVLVFDSPFFCRTGACSSPSSTNFSTPPCCATAVSLLPSSPPSPPPPPLLNHTYTNSQGPPRETPESRNPSCRALVDSSTCTHRPPPHHLLTTSSCPVAFGFCTQLGRPPALLAPTGLP